MHERVMPETAKLIVFFLVRENLAVTYMSEKFIYKLNILMYIRQIQFCRMQGKDLIQKKNKLLTA